MILVSFESSSVSTYTEADIFELIVLNVHFEDDVSVLRDLHDVLLDLGRSIDKISGPVCGEHEAVGDSLDRVSVFDVADQVVSFSVLGGQRLVVLLADFDVALVSHSGFAHLWTVDD